MGLLILRIWNPKTCGFPQLRQSSVPLLRICPHLGTMPHCAKSSIVRTGNVKVEVEDGDVRQLGPGDMVLEEDLTGKGHRGIPVDDQPVILNAVVLG